MMISAEPRKNSSVGWLSGFGSIACILLVTAGIPHSDSLQTAPWIRYEPGEGPGNGKQIVLISGDEEYRSEEALPLLAYLLSKHHGFDTTVLFAIDPGTGMVDPDRQTNIPGLEHLQNADLMVIFTRFRELPDSQMQFIDKYLQAGKPVIGMRTATHAFNYTRNPDSPFARYSYRSEVPGWEGGFGRQILGETWIDHHGDHGSEGTRGVVDGIEERQGHPILRGVRDIWGPTDVYGITRLMGDPDVLVWGESTVGMTPDSPINREKPIMPVAWTTSYTGGGGTTGRVFTTTMGAAEDLESEDLRRLLVNACYWALHMETEIAVSSNVSLGGPYTPTEFGFGGHKEGLFPSDFKYDWAE